VSILPAAQKHILSQEDGKGSGHPDHFLRENRSIGHL
jgi:hypothetical protein